MKTAIATLVLVSALAVSAAPVGAQGQAPIPGPSAENRSDELA